MEQAQIIEEKSIEEKELNTILKTVKAAAKVARGLSKLMLVMAIFLLGLGGFGAYMLSLANWGIWAWILPLLCCGIPAVAAGLLWYAASSVVEAPKVLLELKDQIKEKYPDYAQRFKSKAKGGKGKRITGSIRLCWDLFNVVGDAEDMVFAGTVIGVAVSPVGWIIILVTLAWAGIGSLVMLLLTVLQLIF